MIKPEESSESSLDINDKSSDDLRADVERTRERLSQDVEALGAKLSPDNMKAEAKRAIKRPVRRGTNELRNGVNSATDSVSSFVGSNPLPIALIGVGVGWLIWNARTRPKGGVDYAMRGRAEVYDDYGEDDDSTVRGAEGQLKRLRHQVHDGVTTIKDGVTNIKRSAGVQARRAREKVDELESTAREQLNRAVDVAERGFEERPLLLGAVALGAGLAVGLGIPATQSENQLIGQYRDKLMARAKDGLGELRGKAEGAAQRTYEAAKETAKTETHELLGNASPP
jgi:ElaB/YqjD/DUF883 family membrane-anchored ribosome-binding protein